MHLRQREEVADLKSLKSRNEPESVVFFVVFTVSQEGTSGDHFKPQKDWKFYLKPSETSLIIIFRIRVETVPYVGVDKFRSVIIREFFNNLENKLHPMVYEHNFWNTPR